MNRWPQSCSTRSDLHLFGKAGYAEFLSCLAYGRGTCTPSSQSWYRVFPFLWPNWEEDSPAPPGPLLSGIQIPKPSRQDESAILIHEPTIGKRQVAQTTSPSCSL